MNMCSFVRTFVSFLPLALFNLRVGGCVCDVKGREVGA